MVRQEKELERGLLPPSARLCCEKGEQICKPKDSLFATLAPGWPRWTPRERCHHRHPKRALQRMASNGRSFNMVSEPCGRRRAGWRPLHSPGCEGTGFSGSLRRGIAPQSTCDGAVPSTWFRSHGGRLGPEHSVAVPTMGGGSEDGAKQLEGHKARGHRVASRPKRPLTGRRWGHRRRRSTPLSTRSTMMDRGSD